MNDDPSKRRLGRGLAALIGEIDRPVRSDSQRPSGAKPAADNTVPIETITPNPRNPRRAFNEADLEDLAQSLRAHGLMQPLVVRPAKGRDGIYELIAGERRWRAAQKAGLREVPILVRDVDDRLALELAIVENVQRADLNPVEEALGYQQLIDEHHYTQADLGGVIGKSRSHVANTLRLLKLPAEVRDLLNSGALSAGHARTLVTAQDPASLAKRIVDNGLSVRQAEALAQQKEAPAAQVRSPSEKDPNTAAVEKLLSDATGLGVTVVSRARGGEIRIAYKSLDQFDEVCRRLKG